MGNTVSFADKHDVRTYEIPKDNRLRTLKKRMPKTVGSGTQTDTPKMVDASAQTDTPKMAEVGSQIDPVLHKEAPVVYSAAPVVRKEATVLHKTEPSWRFASHGTVLRTFLFRGQRYELPCRWYTFSPVRFQWDNVISLSLPNWNNRNSYGGRIRHGNNLGNGGARIPYCRSAPSNCHPSGARLR